ncbi:uncharacterized protein A1O5_06171 [Cladophialophora psammophila CBS 110553]|uniref:MICOS complex subunit MIC60 n=1 Tax=Cladophialophora psammophila CBS 110553 TaxID=1182543 RepID=W9WSJ3_9EURO|nr:uncharacterized protein A1O5_06171 [Cladophialophora psammophila CBS 110553]EXJ71177.1 hypothetical protein A1O5_06171 [Cladophialophora psammophila CBS 110553]
MLRLARPVGASVRRQLLAQTALSQRKTFADKKDSILSSDPAFMPGSQSSAAPVKTEVPLGPAGPGSPAPQTSAPTPATPSSPSSNSTVPPQNVPLAPPSPAKTQTAPPTTPSSVSPAEPPSPPPPSQKPPTPRKRSSRFRLLLYLLTLSALTYGGAVFYALRNDNFHDFFTEYIPFGEDAVLYFEEKSFQKRFPHARHNVTRTPRPGARPEDTKVTTIPQKSGLSWRPVEESEQKGSDVTQKGKHMSALDANQTVTPKAATDAKQDPHSATPKERSVSVETAKKSAAAKQEGKPTETPQPSSAQGTSPEMSSTPSTTDSRTPVIPPITHISPLAVPNAEEPVVQELVKIVNDLITVVNSDSADAANKYSAPMAKAKESLEEVASKITTLRDAERKAAEEHIAQAHREFDEGAKQLLKRIETAQAEDDARYREEFETERARLAQLYEEKVKTEVQRSTELAEQRLKNELAEQAIELKRDFVAQIKDLVESERQGRLSKLSDLSTNIDNLTELTSNWNGVIDSNLATQKLQVAVDAVRSALDASAASDAKPRAFVRELAALKLCADGDPIVDAAIASINPSSYQKGIPSQPQLIDRFRRVAHEVRKASLLPENAGIASHAASLVLSNVLFKKHGQPTGDDVESILTRTETMLEEGDLDGAAREMNSLTGWAKVLSRDWLGDVRKVLEVRQALDVIETEARLQCLRVG